MPSLFLRQYRCPSWTPASPARFVLAAFWGPTVKIPDVWEFGNRTPVLAAVNANQHSVLQENNESPAKVVDISRLIA